MKAVVAAFNQEKVLVWSSSVIETDCETDGSSTALVLCFVLVNNSFGDFCQYNYIKNNYQQDFTICDEPFMQNIIIYPKKQED